MKFLSDADLLRLKLDYPELSMDVCPTCDDTGHYRYQGADHPCDCTQQKTLQMLYLDAGIGDPYQRLGWGDVSFPVPRDIMDYLDNIKSYIRNGMGLLLWGPLGTGKTLLANLVLKDLIKMEYDCYSTLFSGTVEQFTAGWNSNEDKSRFAKRFMGSKVLFLDDLGKEFRRSNQLQVTTFDYILRTRVTNNRPTILTTNCTPKELQLGYGSAVLSLLVEKSIDIPITGEDFRPRAHDRFVAESKAGEVRPIQ